MRGNLFAKPGFDDARKQLMDLARVHLGRSRKSAEVILALWRFVQRPENAKARIASAQDSQGIVWIHFVD